MRNDELDIWWTSLSISQKERIAKKGQKKSNSGEAVDPELVRYPACTKWWNSLSEERKTFIHDHCIDRHGYLMKEWDDANPYGD